MDTEMITISVPEYQRLLVAQRELKALEMAGVDNWEGHGYAMEIFWEWGGSEI